MPDTPTLGSILAAARGGRSRASVAALAGTTRETIRRWETNVVTPPLPSLRDYLDALDVSQRTHVAAERAWLERQRAPHDSAERGAA